jgi:hypothetical protein
MNRFMTRGRQLPFHQVQFEHEITLVMRLTVETGTVIVVAALIDLLFYLKETNAGLYQVTAVILCKMYRSALYASFFSSLTHVK